MIKCSQQTLINDYRKMQNEMKKNKTKQRISSDLKLPTKQSLSLSFVHSPVSILASIARESNWEGEEEEGEGKGATAMGGLALGSAFDSKSGQIIMAALLLMIVSFYTGTLFGNNAPLYVSQLDSNSPSSFPNNVSSNGNLFSSTQLRKSLF